MFYDDCAARLRATFILRGILFRFMNSLEYTIWLLSGLHKYSLNNRRFILLQKCR